MRKISLFIGLFSFTANSFSQNAVSGHVKDSTGQAVPFCPMVLLKASDSTQVKGNISDSAGHYLFEKITPGSYFIRYNTVGFKPGSSAVFVIDSLTETILPVQVLRADGVNLSEVAVQVYKPAIEFKKGTVVMNVENDILARGNTVFDLLKRLPGVVIDAQNNISINGATGVRFLIDDRMQQMPTPQVLDMLMGMSAETVTKIELIKNPPARYDAAGTGGLINIVTKRAKVNGYNGSVGFGASQGKRGRLGPNASFNYKSGKFSFFSNMSYGKFDAINETTLERKIITDGNTEDINSFTSTESFQHVFSGSGGVEYDISDNTLIGLYVNGNVNDDRYAIGSETRVNNSGFFNYHFATTQISEENQSRSPNVHLTLLQKIDTTGGTIKLRVSSNNTTEFEDRVNTNRFFNLLGTEIASQARYTNKSRGDFNVYTARLDLNKTFRNKLSLESGLSMNVDDHRYHAQLDFSNRSTGFFVGDTSFLNICTFRQYLPAAYTTLSRSWDKIGFSTGLRAEQTNVDIRFISNDYDQKQNYLSFFPSASIDFTPNKKHTASAAYSYRIRRPHYRMLNPVRQFNDQLNLSVGNPELKPQFSHNFTVDYHYNQFLTVSTGYEHTKDFTFWYSYTPEGSRVKIDTMSNLPRFTNTYLSLSAQQRIKWYNFQTYWVVTRQTFDGELIGEDVSSETFQFYFNMNQEFYLPKNFKFQIWLGRGSAVRHGPQVYLPRSAVHISLSKSFMDQKLNLTLGLNDVFYRDYFSYTTTYSDQSFYLRDIADTRRIRVYVTYRFGKVKIQQRLNTEGS